jgi:hypothetical protein
MNISLSQDPVKSNYFGQGGSANEFKELLKSGRFDQITVEKTFVDLTPAKDQ